MDLWHKTVYAQKLKQLIKLPFLRQKAGLFAGK